MKPTDTDPVDVAVSKLKAMREIAQLQQHINTRVPTLIRQGVGAEDAFSKAMEESNGKSIMDNAKNIAGDNTPKTLKYNVNTGEFD